MHKYDVMGYIVSDSVVNFILYVPYMQFLKNLNRACIKIFLIYLYIQIILQLPNILCAFMYKKIGIFIHIFKKYPMVDHMDHCKRQQSPSNRCQEIKALFCNGECQSPGQCIIIVVNLFSKTVLSNQFPFYLSRYSCI